MSYIPISLENSCLLATTVSLLYYAMHFKNRICVPDVPACILITVYGGSMQEFRGGGSSFKHVVNESASHVYHFHTKIVFLANTL